MMKSPIEILKTGEFDFHFSDVELRKMADAFRLRYEKSLQSEKSKKIPETSPTVKVEPYWDKHLWEQIDYLMDNRDDSRWPRFKALLMEVFES